MTSLRSKAAALLFLIVAVLVGSLSLVYARSSLAELRNIEEKNLDNDITRTNLQLDALLDSLSQTSADWSYWDDSYQYVLDGNEVFESANLSTEAFSIISVDLAAFVNADGTVRYGIWVVDDQVLPLPQTIRSGVQPGGRLAMLPPDTSDEPSGRGNITGVEIIDGRAMLITVRDSRSFTDPAAPPAGLVVMARELGADEVEMVSSLVGRDVGITPCAEVACTPDIAPHVRTSATISRTTARTGLDGQPALALEVTSDRGLYRDGVSNVQRVLLVTVTVGIASVLAGSVLVNRTIVRRLERVAVAALDAGRRRDHTTRVPEEGRDEIAELARGINEMLAGLEDAASSLERARAELELASAAKSRFLARVSHEIRNPLNGVLAFAQLLQLDPLEPQQAEAVGHIVTAGHHITSMLEEFLDIARIEAGAISVELEPLSARTIAIEAVQLSMPLAAERSIAITGAGDDRLVLADPVRLRQVLLNLLSNAIKYNREGGSIFVHVAGDDATASISVTDTGNGIPDEQLPRLFIPFDRLDADKTTIKGSGVGLVVVKQLVELMHGTLSVESRAGVGTRFTVRLPLTTTGTTAGARNDADDRVTVA